MREISNGTGKKTEGTPTHLQFRKKCADFHTVITAQINGRCVAHFRLKRVHFLYPSVLVRHSSGRLE